MLAASGFAAATHAATGAVENHFARTGGYGIADLLQSALGLHGVLHR